MRRVTVLYLVFVSWLSLGSTMQRTLRSSINPDCGSFCKEKNWTTVYLRADGPNDTLHYLWDFQGNPSILMALTLPSASLNISWKDFILRKEKSVTFSEEPIYSFGVMMNKIIEFNDPNDTARINVADPSTINVLQPRYFSWSRKTFLQNGQSGTLDMEGNCYNDTAKNISRNGSVKLSLTGFCFLDHSTMVPHLLHTENSTQVDVVIDHLQTNETFSNSRLAIELLVVSDGDRDATMSVDLKKSIDDEYTPGIFEMVEVKSPALMRNGENDGSGGYLQWRPISYASVERDVSDSAETTQYPPMKVSNRTDAVSDSMLYCFYGEDVDRLLVQRITVSLSSKGDHSYEDTRYRTWTFIIGYGTPPGEQFSYLVIMIIFIGLGLPLVVILAAGLYICTRKAFRRRDDSYLTNR